MITLSITPLRATAALLMSSCGTLAGREGLDLLIRNGAQMTPLFQNALQASSDFCEVGQLFQKWPYFCDCRKFGKCKIALSQKKPFLFEDSHRKGLTRWSYDLSYQPLKAVMNLLGTMRGIQTVLQMGGYFSQESTALQIADESVKALYHFSYLLQLKKDRSKSLMKGLFNLSAAVLLSLHYFTRNRTLGLIGGGMQLLAKSFEDLRKEEKWKQKSLAIESFALTEPIRLQDNRSITSKFVTRLFYSTSLIDSFSDIEQYARTLTFINGCADSLCYLSGSKKHPFFSYCVLAINGMNGLMTPKHLQFWIDPNVWKRNSTSLFSIGFLQLAGVLDTLLFFHETKALSISSYVGKLLVIKTALVAVASLLALHHYYQCWDKTLTSDAKEDILLNGINAATKTPLVAQGARTLWLYVAKIFIDFHRYNAWVR